MPPLVRPAQPSPSPAFNRPAVDPASPFWATADGEFVRLYHGRVTDVLAALPAKSVHMCVTSPPYWGLRDYGTGTWEGGDPTCDHIQVESGYHSTSTLGPNRDGLGPTNAAHVASRRQIAAVCGKCGATRIDQQLGSEPSPDCGTQGKAQCGRCFVCNMVAVFRGVRRVLRDDGTLWLNLGDTYSSSGGHTKQGETSQRQGRANVEAQNAVKGRIPEGVPSGNLVGVPWRVALALQADGWVLRQDIIWHKPAPMPESVRNRCTKAHEYVFLLVKRGGYYCDMEAIKERAAESTKARGSQNDGNPVYNGETQRGYPGAKQTMSPERLQSNMSNKRSVWSVSAKGYDGAHFATFPPKLITPMVMAGTSEYGCCAGCGTPWRRVTEETTVYRDRPNEYTKRAPDDDGYGGNTCANTVAGVDVRTVGWEPGCQCHGKFVKRNLTKPRADAIGLPENPGNPRANPKLTGGSYAPPGQAAHSNARPVLSADVDRSVVEYVSDLPLDDHPVVPCTILDPFVGSGTTCDVAVGLGRASVGIDLSETYLRNNAIPRIEGAIMARPALAGLLPIRAGKSSGLVKPAPIQRGGR